MRGSLTALGPKLKYISFSSHTQSINSCYSHLIIVSGPLHLCQRQRDCHIFAHCLNGECFCATGFIGNGKYCRGNYFVSIKSKNGHVSSNLMVKCVTRYGFTQL